MVPQRNKLYTFPRPSSEFKDAQRNLYYATHILRNRHQPEDITVTNDHQEVLLLDHHLATQLIVASDDNISASKVVAVSTHLTASVADATILVTRNPAKDEDIGAPEGGIIPQVQRITNNGNGYAILRQWEQNPNPTFLEQIQDTVDIFSYLSTLDSSTTPTRKMMTSRWAAFAHLRAFRKLSGRVVKGGQLWPDHPIDAIRDWRKNGDPSSLSFLPLTVVATPSLQMRLEAKNITPDPEHPDKFIANKDNVRTWIDMFLEVFDEIETVVVKKEGNKRHAVKDISEQQAIALARTVQLFAMLLKTPVMTLFLTERSFMSFFDGFQQRSRSKSDSVSSRDQGDATQLPSHVHFEASNPASEGDASDEHIPDASNDMQDEIDVEDADRPIVTRRANEITRYFNTICAWYHSTTFLASKMVKQPIVVTFLHAQRASIEVTDDSLHGFRMTVLDRIQEDERDAADHVLFKVLSLQSRTYYVPVHAESVLMGFMRATSDPSGEPQRESSKAYIPIGVSKKCCWCCWQLSQILQGQGPQFVLGGTHGVIFQWPAPSVGVPTEVVQTMFQKLLPRVVEFVRQSNRPRPPATAQSSPRSAVVSELDFDDDELMDTSLKPDVRNSGRPESKSPTRSDDIPFA